MSKLELKENKMLEVQFVGDDDVLNHILDREGGAKIKKERAQLLVNTKKIIKKPEYDVEEDDQEVLKDQNYVEVLGRDVQASELAKTPRKSVSVNLKSDPEVMTDIPQCSKGHSASDTVQLKSSDKSEFLSTAPRGLRKRLIVPQSHSDSESEYSASNSEEDEGLAQECEEDTNEVILSQKTQAQNKVVSAPVCKETPSKKMKRDKTSELVEEYFEAHSSSKVLTSDRTLQKLKRAKLDQQTLRNLLSKVSPSFSAELKQLNQQYEQLFHKWMLQLHLGFNIVLYGLGSKRDLLERFRTAMLQDCIHVVINGFFPGISVKSILNSITEEVLDHMGTFRSVLDQLDWIINKFKEDSSLELFLLIHNLDSQMLRGDKSQQIIGQLSSLRNIYLIASIDHLNAPLSKLKYDYFSFLRYQSYKINFLNFFFFTFLGLHSWHMEVPRLGVESELQLPAYTTATGMPDPSGVCDLHHSSQQRQILNPLSEARDQTCILMDTGQVLNLLSHNGNSNFLNVLSYNIFCCCCCPFAFSRATPSAYGGSQARGLIRAVATSLHQSSRHCQTPIPLSKARDRTHNLMVPSRIH
uniref:Origin recognition complex subunit 2 n=1 Tax=Sus scrofa TaxID=9823 RepID=A0A8D0QRP6_PIG